MKTPLQKLIDHLDPIHSGVEHVANRLKTDEIEMMRHCYEAGASSSLSWEPATFEEFFVKNYGQSLKQKQL